MDMLEDDFIDVDYYPPDEPKSKDPFHKGLTSVEAAEAFENVVHHKENIPPDEAPLLEEREI
jgi:hypothetical protein